MQLVQEPNIVENKQTLGGIAQTVSQDILSWHLRD